MLKIFIVLFIYIITPIKFAIANSLNISNLSSTIYNGIKYGSFINFTQYTKNKQNNAFSTAYIESSPITFDINQKYQIRSANKHATVIKTEDKTIIDGNGSNGTIRQKFNSSVCVLMATDNYLYLNNFNTLYYSEFSKRLQSLKYNNDLVLFYTIIETFSMKTSFYKNENINTWDVFNYSNYMEKDISQIFETLLKNRSGLNIDNPDLVVNDFINLINNYAKNIFDDKKNINNITNDEFKQIIFEIFTEMKNRMKLKGKFNPLIDTPHLLKVFDYSDEEISKNNKLIEENYKIYIKEHLLKNKINNIYKSFDKNISDYHDFIHNNNVGFNYGISYNIIMEKNTKNNNIFNTILTYETDLIKNNIYYGIGTNISKYSFSDTDINLSNIIFFKIKNNLISSDFGIHYGEILNNGKDFVNLINFKLNNNTYGYFIRLYKNINLNIPILNKFKISNSFFNTKYNITNIAGIDTISKEINKYDDIYFNNKYVSSFIEFFLPNYTIYDNSMNISFGIKNILYLNKTHILTSTLKKYDNVIFIKNNINFNDEQNLTLNTNFGIGNTKYFNANILLTVNF